MELAVTCVAIWIAFGILCAVIAPGRGRSPVAWFFLGLLFCVFGLIALLAMPRLDRIAAPPGIDPGWRTELIRGADGKACPQCAETVKRAALVCRFCGHRFEAPKPSAPMRPIRSGVIQEGLDPETGESVWFYNGSRYPTFDAAMRAREEAERMARA